MSIFQVSSMPWIHLFASQTCNLSCPYCSNPSNHHDKTLKNREKDDFLQSQELLELINNIPPTHFYISGGEPLIHPGIKQFVSNAGKCGHKVSLDTNISLPMSKLLDLFKFWNEEYLCFVNISHHIVSGISLKYIDQRAKLLKNMGIPLFVKYVGVPEMLPQIRENMLYWRDAGIGSAVTLLQGNWKGGTFPRDYTLDQIIALLELVTLNTHGLQIFQGIHSRGIHCRGGQDFIAYNMTGDKRIIPCCHGNSFPIKIDHTFFTSNNREKVKCPVDSCVGDIMFICGINGVTNELDRFENLCHGKFDFVGIKSVINFVEDIRKRGFKLVRPEIFQAVVNISSRKNFQPQLSQKKTNTTGFGPASILLKAKSKLGLGKAIRPLKAKTGPEMVIELEQFICQWQTAEEVIRNNPDLKSNLSVELDKLPKSEEPIRARLLSKKVAQFRFGLPLKCNIEASAVCSLRCEYCVLSDLHKYRRKAKMSFDDFLSIWRYMEPFTTEVELTGGEPLLNNDIFDMIAEMTKTSVDVTLTTNAQLLNEEQINRIIETPPTRILIAYDSSDIEKYESTRIRGKLSTLNNNIKLLIKRKNELGNENPMVVLQIVVHKKNEQDIKHFLQSAEEMKADAASIKPILVWPGIGKKYEKMMIDKYLIPDNALSYHRVDKNGGLVKQRKPGTCPNVQHVHIGSGSEVIPCWYVLKDTYVAGYAADTPLLEIWYSDEYIEYRRKMIKETVNEACPGCIGIYDPKLWSIRNFIK